MKATVEYKGKQVAIDIPDAKLEELIAQKKPRTGYERAELGEPYFYTTASVAPGYDYNNEDMDGLDVQYYAAANYYTDERLARDNSRADKLMRQLRRYAAEHGGIPSVEDWMNGDIHKYFVQLDYETSPMLYVDQRCTYRQPGQVYFLSKDACKAAITEFCNELLWYFTEYEPQVRA